MQSRIVTTKEELQKAYDERADEIIVKGQLAEKLKKTQKLKYVAPATIAGLGAAIAAVSAGIAAAPATGGVSLVAAGGGIAAISASTGLGMSAIIIAVQFGIMVLVSVFRDYDIDTEVGLHYRSAGMTVKLKRKKREKNEDE